ncbi:MAG: RdgB/HAM1 family non-canonical purine NTP pyrophosphatase [Pseudomonadota bacterium]|nr:RdgB/HAM1 family non-canonical purine NTP pyrophosphatase [Pseudomonadota bacterium]
MPHSSAHAPRRRLVVATNNSSKLAEFRSLLAGLPFELQSMGELGLASPEESGASFLANALLKARHAATAAAAMPALGSPDGRRDTTAAALADDSGLEVEALGGAPGIFSARYAGRNADDGANNAKLLAALQGLPLQQRRARYRCALALVFEAEDPQPVVAEGVWEGYILDTPRGAGGFGYDPYFWLPELGLTAAQLVSEHKNRFSHRGIAIRALRQQLIARQVASVSK